MFLKVGDCCSCCLVCVLWLICLVMNIVVGCLCFFIFMVSVWLLIGMMFCSGV